MNGLALVVLGVAGAVYALSGFKTKLTLALGVLPFVTWATIHFPSRFWTLVPSTLLVVLAVHAAGLRPVPVIGGSRTLSHGMTALVIAYGGLSVAQAFNPALSSATIGLRGTRLVVEPLLLYFVGVEVARRPELRRRVVDMLLLTGTVVALYAMRQALVGFDIDERIYYRRNFAVSGREQRVFSTMAGATTLGHFLALVIVLAMAEWMRGARRAVTMLPLVVMCAAGALATGQRGVILSMAVVLPVSVLVGASRRSTGGRGVSAVALVAAIAIVVGALVASTPQVDRREASRADTTAFRSARIKLALLKLPSNDPNANLRISRLRQTRDAVIDEPLGVGSGLNLLLDPTRSQRSTLLGTQGFGNPLYVPPLTPIPGEQYFYTVASELGLPGLVLFLALLTISIGAAAGLARRHPDDADAALALAAFAFLLFVALDSFAVDAMATNQVAAYAWLLVGFVAGARQRLVAPTG